MKAGALALVALLALAIPSSARAQPRPPAEAKPSEPEELRVVVARRARQLTGAEVRIGELRYELIGSRFVGSRIEAGPRNSPYLKLPNLVVELALLGGGAGRTIASIEASGPRISIPGDWLTRAIRTGYGHGAVTVRKVVLRGGKVTVRFGAGGARRARSSQLVLEGVDLDVTDLVIPAAAAGDPFRATGALRLSAKHATLGALVLQRLAIQGKLEGDKLSLDLRLGGLGGSIQLAGKVGIGAELGPFDLKGHAEVRAAGARVWGPLVLKGKSMEALSLEGKLKSARELEAQRGSGGPPLLRMRLKVGNRELRGTPADWQLR